LTSRASYIAVSGGAMTAALRCIVAVGRGVDAREHPVMIAAIPETVIVIAGPRVGRRHRRGAAHAGRAPGAQRRRDRDGRRRRRGRRALIDDEGAVVMIDVEDAARGGGVDRRRAARVAEVAARSPTPRRWRSRSGRRSAW
jgi:hypothetical protein